MMKLIVMAAGCGRRMGDVLAGRPKCLLDVDGRTLLDWQLRAWGASHGGGGDQTSHDARALDDVVIVTGFGAAHLEPMRQRGASLVHNADFADTNMVHSLFLARAHFGEGFVMSYGDIAYRAGVMSRLLASDAPVSVVVDRGWRSYWARRFDDVLSDAESLTTDSRGRITSIGQRAADEGDIEAQYIGLVAFRGEGVAALEKAHALATKGGPRAERVFPRFAERPAKRMFMTDLLQGLINLGAEVAAVPIDGGWVEIDSPRDMEVAQGRLSASADEITEACAAGTSAMGGVHAVRR